MRAWRIIKQKHANTAFTGMGCQYAAGRWHELMTPLVYCADSQSLAILETWVHVQKQAQHIDYVCFEVNLNGVDLIQVEDITSLPSSWRQYPASTATQTIGSDWVRSSQSVALSVPSALSPADRNILFNPHHPDFNQITIDEPEAFSFDARMWKA